MTQIDFSKSPDGYPLWLKDLNPGAGGDMSGWHRDDGDRYTDEDGLHWKKHDAADYIVYCRPEWTGEGMPPVGTVCESMWNESRDEWFKAKVFGVNEHFQPIFRWEEGVKKYEYQASPMSGHRGKPYFRPIRTPEQIAAEEIEAILSWMVNRDSERGLRGIAEDLHADGYRKQVKP